MSYEFIKVKFNNGCRWYFHPKDIVDVSTFCTKVLTRETQAAVTERAANTFVCDDGKIRISYHAVTPMGIGVQIKEAIPFAPTNWNVILEDLVRQTITDRIESIQDETKDLWFTNDISWCVLPKGQHPGDEIVEVIQKDELEFPGDKLSVADMHWVPNSEGGFAVFVRDIQIKDVEAQYLVFRCAYKYITEHNKKEAAKFGVIQL